MMSAKVISIQLQVSVVVSVPWYFILLHLVQGAGYAIGVVGDSGVRANAIEGKMFVGMILILIFGEAIGLYGLIIAIILAN